MDELSLDAHQHAVMKQQQVTDEGEKLLKTLFLNHISSDCLCIELHCNKLDCPHKETRYPSLDVMVCCSGFINAVYPHSGSYTHFHAVYCVINVC